MRFVFRGTNKQDGFIVGCVATAELEKFKSNTVYEMVLVMDTWVLKELGPSHIPMTKKDITPETSEVAWSNGAAMVVKCNFADVVLTKEEYNKFQKENANG